MNNQRITYLNPKCIQSSDKTTNPIYLNPRNSISLEQNSPKSSSILSIAKYHADHVKTNRGMQELLNIIHNFIKDAESKEILPKTNYLFKKFFRTELDKSFSFMTTCCQKVVHDIKSKESIKCPKCNKIFSLKEIMNQRNNYSVSINLIQQIKLLLEKFELKEQIINEDRVETLMDSEVYKEFQKKKGNERVIALVVFADGVTHNHRTFNTLIVQIHDIDANIRLKTFLNCAAMGHSPNLNQILDEFIVSLNEMWQNGILIEKSGKRVYPYLHCFLLDGQARPDYLMQSHHGAKCFCNACLIKGQVVPKGKGHMRAFIYGNEDPELRTHEMSKAVAEAIEFGTIGEENIPFDGIKGKTPLYEISYIDVVVQVPPFESMHTAFGGFVKRDYESMLKESSYPCFLTREQRKILQERIDKISVNSEMKRALGSFKELHKWKINQFADFKFYIELIVFRNLIDPRVYGHCLLLNFIMGFLWNGGIGHNEKDNMKSLIDLYLQQHLKLYPLTDQTSNLHSFTHFLKSYFELGPFCHWNGFIFEAINGETTELITSSTNVIEQIVTRSEIDMIIMLKEEMKEEKDEFITRSSGTIENKSSKIKVQAQEVKSENVNHEFYVMTDDERFYLVKNFQKEDERIMCNGFELVVQDKMKFMLSRKIYKIFHLYHVKIEYRLVTFAADKISEKVMFFPDFDLNSSSISDSSVGIVVRTIYPIHN